MANKLIHELPLATSAASADEIEIQKSGEISTKRIAISALQRLRSTPATEGVTGYLYTSPSTGQTWQLPSFDELQDLPETNAYLYLWLKRIEALELRTFHGNELLSGNVYWVSGLTYHVTDLIYYIDGYLYYADAIDVTLTASDATHPRIEVIYADVNSDIGVLPGTPSTPPIKPLVDETTQIELTFATVLALGTTPSPVPTNELVFDENVGMATEWDTSSSGTGTVDFNNADAPYSNTKCVKVSGAIAGTFLNFIKTASSTTLTMESKLLFRIRSNKAWLNSSGLVVFLLNSGVHFGTNLVIHDGTGGQGHSRNFNYDSTNAAWQTLVVPFSMFNLSTFTLDQITFEPVGNFTSGTEISLDLIQIQEGVTPPPNVLYVLPIATASILGGIKVGTGLSINATTGVLTPNYVGLTDYIEFEFRDVIAGTAQSWDLDIDASFGYTIVNIVLETDDGTLTGVALKIGGTAVTSLDNLTVDTAKDTTVATGANTVVANDRIALFTSTGYTGSPTLIRGKVNFIRT